MLTHIIAQESLYIREHPTNTYPPAWWIIYCKLITKCPRIWLLAPSNHACDGSENNAPGPSNHYHFIMKLLLSVCVQADVAEEGEWIAENYNNIICLDRIIITRANHLNRNKSFMPRRHKNVIEAQGKEWRWRKQTYN